MSRRVTPYMFAGVLGVVSGVYIFRPLFKENADPVEPRDGMGTVKFPDKPQLDTAAPRKSK